MTKEQKWVLERIKKGKINLSTLREEFNSEFNRKEDVDMPGRGGLLPLGSDTRDEVLDIIIFLENEGLLIKGASDKTINANLGTEDRQIFSPNLITREGQRYGKWNWEKISNWLFTAAGLIIALIALLK